MTPELQKVLAFIGRTNPIGVAIHRLPDTDTEPLGEHTPKHVVHYPGGEKRMRLTSDEFRFATGELKKLHTFVGSDGLRYEFRVGPKVAGHWEVWRSDDDQGSFAFDPATGAIEMKGFHTKDGFGQEIMNGLVQQFMSKLKG